MGKMLVQVDGPAFWCTCTYTSKPSAFFSVEAVFKKSQVFMYKVFDHPCPLLLVINLLSLVVGVCDLSLQTSTNMAWHGNPTKIGTSMFIHPTSSQKTPTESQRWTPQLSALV